MTHASPSAMTAWRNILGDDLAVTLNLPVVTSQQTAMPPEFAARFLDVLAAIEDGSSRPSKDQQRSPELERIEYKLDLLMYLLSAAQPGQLPPPVKAILSTTGLVLPAHTLAADTTTVAIYLCRWLSQPLVLALDPLVIQHGGCGARWQAVDSVALQNALSRWVFRLHRQEVARQRRLGGSNSGADTTDVFFATQLTAP